MSEFIVVMTFSKLQTLVCIMFVTEFFSTGKNKIDWFVLLKFRGEYKRTKVPYNFDSQSRSMDSLQERSIVYCL